MGRNGGKKNSRNNRKTRREQPEPDRSTAITTNDTVQEPEVAKTEVRIKKYYILPISNSTSDDSDVAHFTEEEIEDILFNNFEILYNEAIKELISYGYDKEEALKGILRNGHWYGETDVFNNIVQNAWDCMEPCIDDVENAVEFGPTFTNLRELEKYSMNKMICLVQQFNPKWSKGDAMWCLLKSDLQIAEAILMEPRNLPLGSGSETDTDRGVDVDDEFVSLSGSFRRCDGEQGFRNQADGSSSASEMDLQRVIEFSRRFNSTPSLKRVLNRNISKLIRMIFNKQFQRSQASSGTAVEVPTPHTEKSDYTKDRDSANDLIRRLTGFYDLNPVNTSENFPLDKRDDILKSLIHQIKGIEKQLKERKEWAHRKVMQAAKKLSKDLAEIKALRMERGETRRLILENQTHLGATVMRYVKLEDALEKGHGAVDSANAAVRKLENENAEMREDTDGSEAEKSCLQVEKRTGKFLKKLSACEEQRNKLQEDIVAAKQKTLELQKELAEVEAATKEIEAKVKEEKKNIELANSMLVGERRLKKAFEAKKKRKLQALRVKNDIDFQRYKDDLRRLEEEYSQLKQAVQAKQPVHENDDFRKPVQLEDSGDKVRHDWECVICMDDGASFLFFPCSHLVLCENCNKAYKSDLCPYCMKPVQLRIRVYGARSS